MDVVKIAQELIAIDSVTSTSNAAVSRRLCELLQELGFETETLPYIDAHGTSKVSLAARRSPVIETPAIGSAIGSLATGDAAVGSGGMGFFCHSDVVSVDGWNCEHGGPFEGNIAVGRLWGRGACDMKGPTAAALSAVARIARQDQTAPIYFFVTGDEECGMTGARLLAEQSTYYQELVVQNGVGVICEPTTLNVVNTHKGGCHVDIKSTGVAAHSSTAEGKNANWQLIPLLTFLGELHTRCESEARFRNESFSPPTMTMNLVIENCPSSANITVGQAICRVFFRPMPETDWQFVLDELVREAQALGLEVNQLPPLPPLSTPATSPFVQTALHLLGQSTPQAVSYATDGCCFEQLSELIVIGPGNIEQAHRSDEWIDVQQLLRGVDVYQRLLERYATRKGTTN